MLCSYIKKLGHYFFPIIQYKEYERLQEISFIFYDFILHNFFFFNLDCNLSLDNRPVHYRQIIANLKNKISCFVKLFSTFSLFVKLFLLLVSCFWLVFLVKKTTFGKDSFNFHWQFESHFKCHRKPHFQKNSFNFHRNFKCHFKL